MLLGKLGRVKGLADVVVGDDDGCSSGNTSPTRLEGVLLTGVAIPPLRRTTRFTGMA